MKLRSNPFATLVLILVTSTSLHAATLYWNANSGTPDYSGTWDAVTSNWNTATAGGGTPTTWVAAEDAEFSVAQPYTVTVDTAQTATNLNIKAGTVNIAGTSTVSSNNLTIDTGATLTADSNRFLKVGTTTLTVNGTLNQTASVGASTQRVVVAGGNGSIATVGGFRTGGDFNFAGNISGSGAIVTDAAGAFTLNGNNTYTGDTLLRNANILRLGSTTALSSNSYLRVGGGVTIELTGTDFSRTVSSTTSGANVRFNAAADGTGTSGFAAVNADRTVALNGTVQWGSTTTFNPTTFILGTAASTHKVTLTTGFDLNGAARTINSVDGSALVEGEITGTISNSSVTASSLSKTGTGYLLLSGSINGATGGAISLTASGGTMEISGAGTTTYTGNVTVGGGNLLVKRNDALGTGVAGITTSMSGNSQGILQFDAPVGGLSFPEAITLQMRSSLVTSNTSSMKPNFNNLGGNTTLTGLIRGIGGGAVTKISSDAGLLTIATELSQTAAGTRASNLQGAGNALISGTITQVVGTAHRIDKMGSGTWTISNPGNTYTGGTRILQGTLEVTGVGNGGVNGVLGAANSDAANIQLNGGTLKYSGLGETSDRLFTVGASGGTIEASGAGSLVLGNTGAITTANGGATGLQFTFASGSTTVAGNDLSELSPGLEVSGYSGLEAGTKIVSINYSAGLMTVDTETSDVSGAVTSNGTASGVKDRTLTLTGSNTGSNEIKGILADAANLGKLGISKSGAGTWVLSGANTYTGPTAVTDGTLALVGGSQTSPITVDSGATLGFTSGSPTTTSTSTVTFVGAAAKVKVSGTPGNATLMTATSITGTPVLDPAIPGFVLQVTATELKLVSTGATPYTTWANSFLPADVSNPAGDNDNDGLVNQQEFAFGLIPISGSSVNPILVQLDKTTGTFTYQRRAATGLTYKILKSTTLAAGSWTEDAAGQVAGAVDGNGNESVVVTLSGSKPLGDTKLFVRVAAQ